MKQQISKAELSVLDSLAVAADGIQDAQESIVNGMVALLAIESWDDEKIKLVREFVCRGFGPVDKLVESLGLRIKSQPEVFVS